MTKKIQLEHKRKEAVCMSHDERYLTSNDLQKLYPHLHEKKILLDKKKVVFLRISYEFFTKAIRE
jgi:hypothetical protein